MYSPLITFVQVIPANVSGLGAVQGVMIALFAAHVSPGVGDPKAIIIAYSTVIGPLMTIMRLVIGYGFMTTIAKDVLPTEAELAAESHAAKEAEASAASSVSSVSLSTEESEPGPHSGKEASNPVGTSDT